MKYRQLNIDIHNADGCYCSTQNWYYDWDEYKHKSDTVNRLYINQELQSFIDAGYIIGNIFWGKNMIEAEEAAA